MVLTCRPCSGATPTGKKRLLTRNLEARTSWPWARPVPVAPTDLSAIGPAATISRQHGATSPTTGLASSRAPSGWTSPATAKKTAAGARTAARTTDGFRRALGNSCRPTESTLRQGNERINMPLSRSGAWKFFWPVYEGGRVNWAPPEKRPKQIAEFDCRARMTLCISAYRAAVISALRSRSDTSSRRACLLARRRMLAFSGNRADVVQWQNISFPS